MASKKKSVKKQVKVSKAKPIDEKTGYREGSLGFAIGKAYQGETKYESAVAAVEEVIKASAKSKGKSTSEDYVHGRAISWIAFLKQRDSKRFPELPKAEKKVEAAAK